MRADTSMWSPHAPTRKKIDFTIIHEIKVEHPDYPGRDGSFRGKSSYNEQIVQLEWWTGSSWKTCTGRDNISLFLAILLDAAWFTDLPNADLNQFGLLIIRPWSGVAMSRDLPVAAPIVLKISPKVIDETHFVEIGIGFYSYACWPPPIHDHIICCTRGTIFQPFRRRSSASCHQNCNYSRAPLVSVTHTRAYTLSITYFFQQLLNPNLHSL